MQRWYVARGNMKEGPYSAAELRKLSQAGRVSEADMLLREGSSRWVRASSIKGLFNQTFGIPVPAPTFAVREFSAKRHNPWPGRMLKTSVLLLLVGIAVGACSHYVREDQLQNQLRVAETKVREQSEKIVGLERGLADAESTAREVANQLQEKDAAETAKANTAKAEAKARAALLVDLQQRLAELDRKSRDSAAQVAALEEKLAEAVKKEREARLDAEAVQKQLVDAEKKALVKKALDPPAALKDNAVLNREEAKKAFDYLNRVRANPPAFSEEIGVDLQDVRVKPALKWHDTVAKVAEEKARDMAMRDYFDHVTPDGFGINYLLNDAGYKLTAFRLKGKKDNHFESIAAGWPMDGVTAVRQLIVDKGVPSLGHRMHLLGIDPNRDGQLDAGIGYATNPEGKFKNYVCVIIAGNQ